MVSTNCSRAHWRMVRSKADIHWSTRQCRRVALTTNRGRKGVRKGVSHSLLTQARAFTISRRLQRQRIKCPLGPQAKCLSSVARRRDIIQKFERFVVTFAFEI